MEARKEEVSMRKLIASEFVSPDGVIEVPEQEALSYSNAVMEEGRHPCAGWTPDREKPAGRRLGGGRCC
jgi:hypothetical protein